MRKHGLHLNPARIPVKGVMGVTVRDAVTHRKLKRFVIRNTIMYLGLTDLVYALAQRTLTGDTPASACAISTLHIGTGTTPPAASQTALVAEVTGSGLPLTFSNSGIIYSIASPGPFEVDFLVTLPSGTGNGNTLTEAGLFTAGGTFIGGGTANPVMFARQIHPGIPKTSALVVDYDWRISFTA